MCGGAGELLRVCERVGRICGKSSFGNDRRVVGGGGLKKDRLERWLKRQMKAYEAGKLPAR